MGVGCGAQGWEAPALITDARTSFMTPSVAKMGAREARPPPVDLDPSVGTFIHEEPGPEHGGRLLSMFHVPKPTPDRCSWGGHWWDAG